MEEQFDAIVIGSGISGGWAAKELCDKGLKVLLLERGRDVVHLKDYPTATKDPWQLAHRGEMPPSVLKENPIVAKCYAFGEATEHFFVKDKEHPRIMLTAYVSNNRKTVIKVADNGYGMAEELLDKIFVPFFSTKKSGSGIGLSLCKQIMMLHKGNIQVHSVEGEGTAFQLQF